MILHWNLRWFTILVYVSTFLLISIAPWQCQFDHTGTRKIPHPTWKRNYKEDGGLLPVFTFSLDYKTVAHSVLLGWHLLPAGKCWNQLSNTNLSKLQKERSFLIDIMQTEILILHRVVQELSNNIKTLLPTYSSHLSLNGNRYIFFFSLFPLSLICFFYFFPA